jgi:hypothetical protein
MLVCMYVFMYVCMYARVNVNLYECVCKHTCIMHVCLYVCALGLTGVHMHSHAL